MSVLLIEPYQQKSVDNRTCKLYDESIKLLSKIKNQDSGALIYLQKLTLTPKNKQFSYN